MVHHPNTMETTSTNTVMNKTMTNSFHNRTISNDAGDTELYCVIGILSFLSVMGTAGNLLVLYVFSQKKDKLVSTLFILVLAFVDFTTCLFVIPYTIYMEYVSFKLESDIVCKLYQFLITSNIPFSALVMVAIAIDRYFCICHPFLHALNLNRAKIMITCLALVSTGLGIIVGLMYGVWAIVPNIKTNGTHALHNLYGDYYQGNSTAGVTFHYRYDYELYSDVPYTVHETNSTTPVDGNQSHAYFPRKRIVYNTGHCQPNELILSSAFQWLYQKIYILMYLLCLIIVIVLYSLIYHSVLARRSKRQKQKSKSLPLVIQTQVERIADETTEETTMLTSVNGDSKDNIKNGNPKMKDKEKSRRKSTKRDRTRIANLKTAAMLFVVTVVFIVTFLPAFLMALEIVPYSLTIFYMYFANNVANPVIYSFMNKNFRDDLRKLFCG